MEKNHKKLIFFMPSMEGGGVEKNLVIIANYFIKKIKNISLITYDNRFNKLFDSKIKIINVVNKKNTNKKKILQILQMFKFTS